jgi:transposase-like protein
VRTSSQWKDHRHAQALSRGVPPRRSSGRRKGEIPLTQIAKDFGISQSCVKNWVKQADIEDGHRPGATRDESAELREARKRIRQLEQEAEVMRRAVAYFSRDVNLI